MTYLKACDNDLREGKQKDGNRHKYMWGYKEGPLINGIDKDIHPNGIYAVGGKKKNQLNTNFTQIGKIKFR